MGESEIAFGDKIFLYGQYVQNLHELEDYEYNTVMGYMTTGGYLVTPFETDLIGACIPGFVTEIPLTSSLALQTPFSKMWMVDITDRLSLALPLPTGTKVWMPTTPLP